MITWEQYAKEKAIAAATALVDQRPNKRPRSDVNGGAANDAAAAAAGIRLSQDVSPIVQKGQRCSIM